MKITVIGTGYVGLVTGVCLAETGNHVYCVDIDTNKIDKLNNRQLPIYEPGLETLFKKNITQNRLQFTTSLEQGLEDTEIIFLALPTPPSEEDGAADLSYVFNACKEIAPMLKKWTIIVTKSTVPVGTADQVKAIFDEYCKVDFDIVSNPEFLREGVAVEDFMKPDRIVIGTTQERPKNKMSELYEPYIRQGNPILFMDIRSAELTKYAANCFLAMKISFMNEIANLSEKLGSDVDAIRKGIGTDPRIGNKFLYAGIGYGGSCFPKDVKALVQSSKKADYNFRLLNSVVEVNEIQKSILFNKIQSYFKKIEGKTFALWGAAFKPETDDIREAPALDLIDKLLKAKAKVTLYDPIALENVKSVFGDQIKYAENAYDALEGAEALAIVTEWSEFRNPDFEDILKRLKRPIIFDGRNVFKIEKMKRLPFHYESMGREVVDHYHI